jgi:hypothetical protein
MSRQLVYLAVLCMVASLSGCATGARYVTTTSNAGVVAIPTNSNSWPHYYHKQAEDLMQAKCPEGYDIEKEGEFVTGATQQTTSTTNKTGDPLLAALYIAPVTEKNNQTTIVNEQTEWRIYYRKKGAPAGSGLALAAPVGQAAPAPAPLQSAVTLTPPGTPLPTLPTPLVVGPTTMTGPPNSTRPGNGSW